MKYITRLKLAQIHVQCDEEDKSTEWMIQYMQDALKLPLDAVMSYLQLDDDTKHNLKMDSVSLHNVGVGCYLAIHKIIE
jgi:hypothetical protein